MEEVETKNGTQKWTEKYKRKREASAGGKKVRTENEAGMTSGKRAWVRNGVR